VVWAGVAAATLALLAVKTPREAFKETLQGLRWGWAGWALGIYVVAQALLAARWVLLLEVQGVRINLFQAVRLTYLGLFYNNMMPGSVGGDLLKAWYVTRHSERGRRVEAAVTVLVDRLVGLGGMMLVAAGASVFVGSGIAYRGVQLRWVVWGMGLAMAAGAVVVVSRRVRRVLLVSAVMKRLPFAQTLYKADAAIQLYRRSGWTMVWSLVLTVVIQGTALVAVWMLTQSLGLAQVRLVQCVTLMPVIWVMGAAIPVPGGLGVVEGAITYLFCLVINPAAPGSAAAQAAAAALALLNRMMICLSSLPGALVPIFGGHLPKREEMQAELEQEGAGGGVGPDGAGEKPGQG